jgi:hypothetical protein
MIEKINRTECVRNDVLHGVKEGMNIAHTIHKGKANWIGRILRRNCVLKHVIEGKIMGRLEVTGEDVEEDIKSYWMTLRKGEDTRN